MNENRSSLSAEAPATTELSLPAPPKQTNAPAEGRHRLASLDALRGLAAVSVMMLHFTVDFHRDFKPSHISDVSWGYGAYGVHLFFLISGFVILMTAERANRPFDFALSRFSRLYPPYWVAVALTTVLLLALPTIGAPTGLQLVRRALVSLTMFQTWLGIGSVDSVYWTLQIEMSFYLILLLLIWRKAINYALPVMTGLTILSLCDHVLVPRPLFPAYVYLRQVLFLEWVYLFTAGIVIYKLRSGFKRRYLLILALCALCPATATYWPNNPPQDTCIAIGLAGVLYLATSGRMNWIACRPLVYLGAISYSLYLTHHWLGQVFLDRADKWGMNPNLALAESIILCLVAASVVNYLVERPSLRWIRQTFARKSN